MNERNRQILRIALPSIVSNITVPLLGLIDVAIVGHMGSAAYIGAVAVGSMIFNLTYWLFSFLRMSTSGMTAQALGRRSMDEASAILIQSSAAALTIAALLIVLQQPVGRLMMWLIGPTADVLPLSMAYFRIVVWGAPAVLTLYVLTGWYIGMQNTRIPMVVSIVQNIVNIAASLVLVYGLDMKMEGVATGTVIAQYAGTLMALALMVKYYRRHLKPVCSLIPSTVLTGTSANLFLRTLCMVAVNLFFTSAGARSGAVILSVNTVLMQLFLFFSYFMDGFAYAGEALGGRYYGARNWAAFHDTVRRLFLWAAAVTAVFSLLYVTGGMAIVSMLTDEPSVVSMAHHFIGWAWAVPACGAAAFIWDGLFIGITDTKGMLVALVAATAAFFAVYWGGVYGVAGATGTAGVYADHVLWLALVVFLSVRGIVQTLWFRMRTYAD